MATDQLGPDSASQPRNVQRRSKRNRILYRWPAKLARFARWFLVILFLAWVFWVTLPNLVNFLVTPGTPGLFILLFLFIEVILVVFLSGAAYLFYRFTTRTRVTWMRSGATQVSFADYRGNPTVLAAARHLVTLLKTARTAPPGVLPGGVLLRGVPGSGRRYLARAVATEARLPLGYLSLAPLSKARLGRFKIMLFYRRARKLAREYGACIVFLDGLDLLVGETDILSELLFQLDLTNHTGSFWDKLLYRTGFVRPLRNPPPVVTLAAVTPATPLPPALHHPGRFTWTIAIGLPDTAGRREILTGYLDQHAHAPLPLERMLAQTSNYTPLALRQMVAAAALHARAAGRSALTYADFSLAGVTGAGGQEEPADRLSYAERRRLAYYVAGRAYAQRKLMPAECERRLTRVHLQLNTAAPEPGHADQTVTREELLTAVQIRLAGRATEEELLGTATGVAQADLRQATLMTASLVGAWGMDQRRGAYLTAGATVGEMLLHDGDLRERVEAILQEQYRQVRRLIANNGRAVMLLAEALLLCNELIDADIDAILEQAAVPQPLIPVAGEP